MNKPSRRKRFGIHDPRQLADMIGQTIAEQFAGNLSAAARKIKIPQPELYRLSKAQLGAIGFVVAMKLRKLFHARSAEFERCLVSPAAQELYAAYRTWLAGEWERIVDRSTLGDTPVGRATMSLQGWDLERLSEFNAAIEYVRFTLPELCESFDRWLAARQHSDRRVGLAYFRIVAPLLDARESGFVERRWEELSAKELRRFVKAGMERERILLSRPPDIQQAQLVAERNPIEMMTIYSWAHDPRAYMGRNVDPLLRKWVLGQGARPR